MEPELLEQIYLAGSRDLTPTLGTKVPPRQASGKLKRDMPQNQLVPQPAPSRT